MRLMNSKLSKINKNLEILFFKSFKKAKLLEKFNFFL